MKRVDSFRTRESFQNKPSNMFRRRRPRVFLFSPNTFSLRAYRVTPGWETPLGTVVNYYNYYCWTPHNTPWPAYVQYFIIR